MNIKVLFLTVCFLVSNVCAQESQNVVDALKNAEYVSDISINSKSDVKLFDKNIKKFKSVTSINIQGGDITSFPKSICSLKNLQHLRIYLTEIKELPKEIGKLSSLELIDISGDDMYGDYMGGASITRLPNEIGQLKRLRELKASFGVLTFIPSSIAECESLQILDLDNNPFISIPFAIFQLKYLQELGLNCYSLTSLPQDISSCKSLNKLRLGGKAYNIPNGISKLQYLTDLKITYPLSSIPEELFTCSKLVNLDIVLSSYTDIPDSFNSLINLENLSIIGSNNETEKRTRTLPFSISSLKKLKSLTLSNLGLKEIGTYITSLPNLETLNLSNNEISKISIVQSNITDLTLSNNKISAFEPSFKNLKKLKTLDLSYNTIKEFHPVILEMDNIESINLSSTEIQTISQEILKKLGPVTFYLAGTPFGVWLQSEKGQEFFSFYEAKQINFQTHDPNDYGG
jgi:Leucine-rich repeat (LRR) protein